MMKKTTGDCDESCDCHDDKIVVGERVYIDPHGGNGMSDEMKELLKRKETLKQKGV